MGTNAGLGIADYSTLSRNLPPSPCCLDSVWPIGTVAKARCCLSIGGIELRAHLRGKSLGGDAMIWTLSVGNRGYPRRTGIAYCHSLGPGDMNIEEDVGAMARSYLHVVCISIRIYLVARHNNCPKRDTLSQIPPLYPRIVRPCKHKLAYIVPPRTAL